MDLSWIEIWKEYKHLKLKINVSTSTTGMIFLDNVKVPKINKLNIEGMKGPLSCLKMQD